MCTEDVIVGMNEISNSMGKNRNKEIKLKRPFRCEFPTSAMPYY
jgi:hypothetical protein